MTKYKMLNGKKVELTKEELNQIEIDLKNLPNEELEELRINRNNLLAKTDYLALSDVTMSDAWKKYRQDLRDITKTFKSMNDKDVKRLVICSGKVFYDLFEAREKNKLFNIKILRLEQIYPFPIKSLQEFISKTPQAEIIWCQEEPENMGSWSFIDRRLEKVLIDCNCQYKRPVYVGRPEAASPATGTMSRHLKEQKLLVNQALGLEKINTASAA